MKCAACGYKQVYEQTRTVDKVARYKSGPRKGEVKNITKETIVTQASNASFTRLSFPVDVTECYPDSYFKNRSTTIYACPECGTLKIEVI